MRSDEGGRCTRTVAAPAGAVPSEYQRTTCLPHSYPIRGDPTDTDRWTAQGGHALRGVVVVANKRPSAGHLGPMHSTGMNALYLIVRRDIGLCETEFEGLFGALWERGGTVFCVSLQSPLAPQTGRRFLRIAQFAQCNQVTENKTKDRPRKKEVPEKVAENRPG